MFESSSFKIFLDVLWDFCTIARNCQGRAIENRSGANSNPICEWDPIWRLSVWGTATNSCQPTDGWMHNMALYWWQPPDARRINFIINFHILSPFFIFCIVLWIHFHAKVQPDLKETKRGLATRNGIFLADLWHWVGKIIWTKRELCQLCQKPFHIKPMLFTGFIRVQSFIGLTIFLFLGEPTTGP